MSLYTSHEVELAGAIIDRHLTVQAAPTYSGYIIQYLKRLLRDGTLSGVKFGHVWLIELDAYIEYIVEACRRDDRRCGSRKVYNSNATSSR